jgi:hypothetical protein
LFDRPKPTAGCSANGRRRRYYSVDGQFYEQADGVDMGFPPLYFLSSLTSLLKTMRRGL